MAARRRDERKNLQHERSSEDSCDNYSDDGFPYEKYADSNVTSDDHDHESDEYQNEMEETELLCKREPKHDVFVEDRHPSEKYKGHRRDVPKEPKPKKSRPVSLDLEFEHKVPKPGSSSKDQLVFNAVKSLEIENEQILSELAKSQSSDLQKGLELKEQLKISKSLSTLLLDLHGPLKRVNAFPSESEFSSTFAGQADRMRQVNGKLFYLLSKVLYLNCRFNGISYQKPSLEIERLWQQIEGINSTCLTSSLKELDLWSGKLHHASVEESKVKSKQLKVINQSLSSQLETLVRDEARLIKKTQINREKIAFLHNKEIPVESAAIYDDTDFYLTLQKERDNLKFGSLNDPDKIAVRVNALKNSKIKKRVDTRASKGRKIKYVAIDKLANFMAPCDKNSLLLWPDEKRDEFFCSLFGNTPKPVQQ